MLALVTDAFGEYGGIAQYNRDLLVAMSSCEIIEEVVVLPRRTAITPEYVPQHVRQLASPAGKLSYVFSSLQIALKNAPFDIVFCGHIYMAPLAAVIAARLRSSLWIQVHGLDAWTELSAVYRRAAERASLITSVSRYTRQRLLEWLDFDPHHVKILSNTVDPRFSPGPRPDYLIDRHNVRGNKVLLTVSRLPRSDRYKGVDRVIRCLPRILKEFPDVMYLVAGDGDDRPWLQALAAECAVSRNVQFVGQVSADELPDYYRLANAFVMPSTGEGFGIVFVEAIASGIDAIGGNKDGTLDALSDGVLGATIDPDDPAELASAICATLANPVCDSSRADRFNFEKFSTHLDALLRSSLLSSTRG